MQRWLPLQQLPHQWPSRRIVGASGFLSQLTGACICAAAGFLEFSCSLGEARLGAVGDPLVTWIDRHPMPGVRFEKMHVEITFSNGSNLRLIS